MPTKANILLTGATGFVGSHLLTQLLGQEYRVFCLLRFQNGVDPGVRLRRALDFVAGSRQNLPDILPQLNIVMGDVTRPNLGINQKDYQTLKTSINQVIHCAAQTNFPPDSSTNQWQCNVEGTENLIRFALEAEPAAGFHYLSTAYVAGDRRGVIYESELDEGQGFYNGYEKSKFFAEKMLLRYREQADVNITIYRPSIIVGDYQTGQTTHFNGMYLFLRFLQVIKEFFRDSQNNGKITVPVRGIGEPGVTKNFVPIDYVVKMIMAVFLRPEAHGRTYHITHDEPPPLATIKDVMEDVLGITGTQFVNRGSFRAVPPTDIEQLLRQQIEPYIPYLLQEPSFDNRQLKAVFADVPACSCPPMDREALTRLFTFAIKSDWGKKLRRTRDVSGLS